MIGSLNTVVICGGARTAFGSFMGGLSSVPAPKLGATAIKAAVERAGVETGAVQEVYMGSVLQAGLGQAPARQAALHAGLNSTTPCTTVNKVCASGMKAITLAAQSLMTGSNEVMVAGGMESMSRVPFYLDRGAIAYGGQKLKDGIVFDGLTDAYDQIHMGNCGENTASKLSITREQQDQYAISSYERSAAAAKSGLFDEEICPVLIPGRRGKADTHFSTDEEFSNVDFDRFSRLKPAFDREKGTITAGNASTLNDGAAALVLTTEQYAARHQLRPLARVISCADAACQPIDFPLAPVHAINKLLKQASVRKQDVSLWEINEAFSVVALADMKLLELDSSVVNIHGGAVSLGHPIGASGARITLHLVHALKAGQKGVAAICNGGGGATAILLEKL